MPSNFYRVKNVLADGGYTGMSFAQVIEQTLGVSLETVKRNELHTFMVIPKRRVIERSFAWKEKR